MPIMAAYLSALGIPHGKVEHKARFILVQALYSERYIKPHKTADSISLAGKAFFMGGGKGWLACCELTICSPCPTRPVICPIFGSQV
jgi:hypothetical protein